MNPIGYLLTLTLLAFASVSPAAVDTITREVTLSPGAIFSNPASLNRGTAAVSTNVTKGQSFHIDYSITATALTLKLHSTQSAPDFNGSLTVTFSTLTNGAPAATSIATVTATLPAGVQAGNYLRFDFASPIVLPAGDLAITVTTSDTSMNLESTTQDQLLAGQLLRLVSKWQGVTALGTDLVLAIYGTYTPPAARPAPATGPNIVMILADDLGWTDISTGASNLGNPSDFYETPNIATLASQGVAFTSCYMQPNCSPTRAALLTGQYAPRTGNGVYNVTDLQPDTNTTLLVGAAQNQAVPAATTTIAERLRAGGYVTVHMGKYHVGGFGVPGTTPLEQGFDFNFSNPSGGSQGDIVDSMHPTESFAGSGLWHYSGQVGPEYSIFANPYSTNYLTAHGWPTSLAGSSRHLTDTQADAFENFLHNHRAGPLAAYPLYVQLHTYAVHAPIDPRADLLAYFQAKTPGIRHNDPAYAAVTAGEDQFVGRVMAALNDPNGDGDTSDSIANNTVLVFASDNGGVGNNFPLRDHKRSFYEGGLRVPLIVRWPGVYPAGKVTDRMVHAVDFYSTFCQIAGIAAGNVPDSVPFTSALTNPATAVQRGAIFYHFPGYTGSVTKPQSVVIKNIGARRYKYITFYENGNRELYDLTDDLSESRNLLGGNYWDWLLHGAAAQELAGDLDAWLTRNGTDWQPVYPIVRATGQVLGPPDPAVPAVTVPFAQTFRITDMAPAANPAQITLTWPSGAGFTYAVDGSSDLLTWVPLAADIVATGATTTLTVTDPLRPTSPNRFYRARLTQGP